MQNINYQQFIIFHRKNNPLILLINVNHFFLFFIFAIENIMGVIHAVSENRSMIYLTKENVRSMYYTL